MKRLKIILPILLSCIGLEMKGQDMEKDVYSDKFLHKFVGTWECNYDNTTFQLVLVRATEDNEVAYGPCLVGGYKLITNNAIVEDYTMNLPSTFVCYQNFPGALVATEPRGLIEDLVIFSFIDKRFKKSGDGEMELLSPTTAKFTLKNSEGVRLLLEGESSPPKGFSVPTDVILTKIK